MTGIGLVGAQELSGRARGGHGRLPDGRAPGGVGPGSRPKPTPQPARPRRRPPARATRGWPPPSPEIAVTAGRTSTSLGERYRRIAKRRGKQRALVAVGNSVLTIIWHLLADPEARSGDLGPDFYQSRSSRHRQEHNLIRQLQQLTGKTVTLTPTRHPGRIADPSPITPQTPHRTDATRFR